FLRRCTFFHIKPPSDSKLLSILTNRLGEGAALYGGALKLYNKLRTAGLEKSPATAELMAWVAYLRQRGITDLSNKEAISASLVLLVKSEEDLKKARALV